MRDDSVLLHERQLMEKCFQEQEERIDRLMRIIRAKDQHSHLGDTLTFYDILTFACQCMWHLRDWVLNDVEFHAKNKKDLEADIYAEKSIVACGDIANCSKHLIATPPKDRPNFALLGETGIHDYPSKGIFQVYYRVVCSEPSDPFHGIEIRDLLEEAWAAWHRIIEKHHLTHLTFWVDMERKLEP